MGRIECEDRGCINMPESWDQAASASEADAADEYCFE